MKLVAQIKFGSGKQKVIKFDIARYLVYIISKKEDEGSMDEFIHIMAREFTVPPGRFHYKGKQGESYIFEVD